MPVTRDRLASVSLGSTTEIGLQLVADGRPENLSEACRAGLRRLAEDARFIDRLVTLGNRVTSRSVRQIVLVLICSMWHRSDRACGDKGDDGQNVDLDRIHR